MSADRQLALARWLAVAGAGRSARNVLGTLRGAAANRIRLAAEGSSLRPGIYGLVALPDGTGAVLPLRPTAGHPRATDHAFREACVAAHAHASSVLDDGSLPMLRFELEEELEVFGPSIGLPAALAFIAHFAPSRAPRHAVVATGGLLPDGRIVQVGHLDAKYTIALEERAQTIVFPPDAGDRPGVDEASSFADAARIVFGEAPLRLDIAHSAVDGAIRRARALPPAGAIALLESLDARTLTPADRARILFDMGSFHRNLGHSRRASELHVDARGLLQAERHVIGEEAAERYELECLATELDRYALVETTASLRERLGRPFLKLRNELRCRGMLAQGIAMAGDFAGAVAVRSANLALHDRSDALAKIRPATLCHLALDAALAGDANRFEESVVALRASTRPGDEPQWRFNATAIVRGLVALGRHDDALRWSRDEIELFGCRSPATLTLAGSASVVTAPELSALRALVRAGRRCGDVAMAETLGTHAVRAAGDPEDLFGWMAGLLLLELGLANRNDATTRDAQARLVKHHPVATRFHARLLSPSVAERESELDRVWY